MNAAERWERYYDRGESGPETFALRGDGALVIFDEDGWFTMQTIRAIFAWSINPECDPRHPDERRIFACDPDGTPHDIYCEPSWLSGYFDELHRMTGR